MGAEPGGRWWDEEHGESAPGIVQLGVSEANTADGGIQQAHDPIDALEAVSELPENTIVVLRDFHAFLDDAKPRPMDFPRRRGC